MEKAMGDFKFVPDGNPKKVVAVAQTDAAREFLAQLRPSATRIRKGDERYFLRAFADFRRGRGCHAESAKIAKAVVAGSAAESAAAWSSAVGPGENAPRFAQASFRAATLDDAAEAVVRGEAMWASLYRCNLGCCTSSRDRTDHWWDDYGRERFGQPKFEVTITVPGGPSFSGDGSSKKAAKAAALGKWVQWLRRGK